MGRVKTKLIKRLSNDLFSEYAAKLSKEFQENKQLLGELASINSKKMRNVIAGMLTKLKKNEEVL